MSSSKGQDILTNLIEVVKLSQTKYCNKKELATENDELILKLCNLWEDVLTYGLRTYKTINDFADLFKNVQDIVSGSSINSFSFWDFCKNHLSIHERERFENLKNVSTKDGRMRALIRASLNEHSLQRYISTWLSDSTLLKIYEPNALMIDSEATNLFPNLANGLNTILFAINVDCPTLNLGQNKITREPIIYAPTPTSSSKNALAIERDILSYEDDNEVEDAVKILDNINNTTQNKPHKMDSINIEAYNFEKDNITFNCNELDTSVKAKIHESVEINKPNKDAILNEYVYSLSGKTLYENDSSDKEYLESETSSNLSKSASYSGFNISSSNTQSIVSESLLNDVEKIKVLEEQLSTMTERCTFLENRVSELSLENHRLLKLKNYIDNDFGNYNVTIPKVNLVIDGNSKHYIYEIHITSRERESWSVSRRYSNFYKLYQNMLKKHNSLVKSLDFPPKKKLGNMNASFVEERRQRLQMYLRNLLKILPEISLCTSKEELEVALPFFK